MVCRQLALVPPTPGARPGCPHSPWPARLHLPSAAMLVAWILAGCEPRHPAPADADSAGAAESPGDSADRGDDTGGSLPDDIVPTGEDLDLYARWGATVSAYDVNRPELAYPNGGTAEFRLIWPVEPGPDPLPVVILLHPATVDVDDERYPEGRYGRCADPTGPEAVDKYFSTSVFTPLFLALGGVVAIPVSSHCDLYLGLGPDDPVDTRHAGGALTHALIDWLLHAQTRVPIDDDRVAIMGARFPSVGASLLLPREPDIDIFLDVNAPNDMTRYWAEPGYCAYDERRCRATVEHIWGGPPWDKDGSPTEWYDRFVDSSPMLALPAGRYALPTLHLYNSLDPISPAVQHAGMTAALAGALDPLGLRWSEFDLDNVDAGHDTVHNGAVPSTLSAAFALGAQVASVEGEALFGTGDVGARANGALTPGRERSGGGVLAAAPGEAGVLASTPVPLDSTGEISATFFVNASGEGDAATIELLAGDEVVAATTLVAEELAAMLDGSRNGSVESILVQTLRVTADGRPLSARVRTTGNAAVELDAITFAAWP